MGLRQNLINIKRQAKREGKAEAQAALAQNLIRLGMDNQLIAKATGILESKIAELRSQLAHKA